MRSARINVSMPQLFVISTRCYREEISMWATSIISKL